MQLTPKKVIFPAVFFIVFIVMALPLLASNTFAEAAPLKAGILDSDLKESNFLLSANFPDRIQQWRLLIENCAAENKIAADLIGAVILQESDGEPNAISPSGAVGLMQVMPRDGKAAEFLCSAGPCFVDRPESNALFNPEFNIAYGCNYLSGLIEKTSSTREALRLYGPMDVSYSYADMVLEIYERYR